MKFNGNGWVYVGNRGFSGGSADFPSIKFSNGVPFIAFQDGASNWNATVMKYDDTAWVAVGTKGFSNDGAMCLSLAATNGIPYVAYSSNNGMGPTAIMKFDGSLWRSVEIGGPVRPMDFFQSLSLWNNMPYIAFLTGLIVDDTTRIRVIKLDGTDLTSGINLWDFDDYSSEPSLCISNNDFYVAYCNLENGGKATVKRLR